jgi:hypothetical protein
MKPYNRAQDLKNRLKLAVVILGIASLIFWITSCKDEDTKQTIIGTWSFSSAGSNPVSAKFDIVMDGTYKVQHISVNNNSWKNSALYKPTETQASAIIIVSDSTESDISKIQALGFINCRVINNSMSVDSVVYVNGIDSDPVYLLNQSLKKN